MLCFLLFSLSAEAIDTKPLRQSGKPIMEFLVKLKANKRVKLAGVDTIQRIPDTSDFFELKSQALAFIMGEYFPYLPIFVIAALAVILMLVYSICVIACCKTTQSKRPGCCIVISWIIFTLFLLASLVYYVFGMLEMPNFLNNYPKIPDYISEGASSTTQSLKKLNDNTTQSLVNTFDEIKVDESFYGLEKQLINDKRPGVNNLTKLDVINNQLLQILQINNTVNDKLDEFPSIPKLKLDVTNIDKTQKSVDPLANVLNEIDVYNSTINLSRYLTPTSVMFQLNSAIRSLTDLSTQTIPQVAPSFKTDALYYIALRYLYYIVFGLLVVFYIILTACFCNRNKCSRCCAASTPIISFFVAIVICIIGLVTTAMATAIQDVCLEPSQFASNWYSNKPIYKSLKLPPLNTQIFENPDGNLYELSKYNDIFNLIRIAEEGKIAIQNNKLTINSGQQTTITNNVQILQQLNITSDLIKIASDLEDILVPLKSLTTPSKDDVIKTIENYIVLIESTIKYYSDNYQVQLAIIPELSNSLGSADTLASSYDTKVRTLQIPFEENANIITTGNISNSYNSVEEVFCQETGIYFAYIAIFSHFYLVSLIGFAGLMICRKRGMDDIFINKPVEERDASLQNDGSSSWMTVKSSPKKRIGSAKNVVNDSSSSDTSFDMYEAANSRLGLY